MRAEPAVSSLQGTQGTTLGSKYWLRLELTFTDFREISKFPQNSEASFLRKQVSHPSIQVRGSLLDLARSIAMNDRIRLRRLQYKFALLVLLAVLTGCQPVGNNANRSPFGLNTPRIFGNRQFANNGQNRFFQSLNSLANRGSTGFANSGQNVGTGSGFANSPFNLNGGSTPNNQGNNPYAGVASEFNQLNNRITAYDADNQLLNTELASLKQKLGLANQYSQTLKQQLADTATRAQQAELAQQNAAQQLVQANERIEQLNQAVARANSNGASRFASSNGSIPSQLPSAMLNANNSLSRRLGDINIPGGMARLDGDVIRIEFPSENLFVPGKNLIQPAQLPLLQSVVGTIRQSFPRQIVGIEAHWDNSPTPNVSHHQLTATQALSMFERLVAMGVPQNQLFTMAMGSNRPRHAQQVANGIHPNRRIELVIYPETFD